jgi:cell wall-associated NlpC family hydrolase
MRKEPNEASEMVNQVLFGECFSVLEENKPGNLSLIQLHHDKYEGWINSKCVHKLSDHDWKVLQKLPIFVSHDLQNILKADNHTEPVIIGCGSILRCSSPGKTRTERGFCSIPDISLNTSLNIRESLVCYGKKLLSVPYLWGGRSSFGFDCSGLCQNLYRQVGIEIPRDSSAQASLGNVINFIEESQAGDLAFFDNDEGIIIHVGMILGENKILHASGRVKIDFIDHQGIFSIEQNRYTHKLRLIKKLVE